MHKKWFKVSTAVLVALLFLGNAGAGMTKVYAKESDSDDVIVFDLEDADELDLESTEIYVDIQKDEEELSEVGLEEVLEEDFEDDEALVENIDFNAFIEEPEIVTATYEEPVYDGYLKIVNEKNKEYYVDPATGKKFTGFSYYASEIEFYYMGIKRTEKGFFNYKGNKYYVREENAFIIRARDYAYEKYEVEGEYYLFDQLGRVWKNGMKRITIDEKTGIVYANRSGRLERNGKVKISGCYYYFDEDCFAKVNTVVEIDGDLYYAKADGKFAMKVMFKDIDGNTRYAKPGEDGKLARDEVITINGIKYFFNEDGICFKILKYGKEI